VATSVAARAADPAARRDADLLKQKIVTIVDRGEVTGKPAQPHRTTVMEREVNAYLTLEAADDLPTGVVGPAVTMLGGGRVSGRAVVDLDRVRQELKATSVFNPLSYLKGRLPVVGTGTLRTADGVARFQFESAHISGVPIPKLLLQQIIAHYSRSETFPSGISLDDPFALPARIREIRVDRGQATVVQ
jgi:hypothetical protein